MIALLLALQAPAPAPAAAPVEVLPVAAAGLATRVTFDAAGAITGCATEVRGLVGPIDGCLLFAKPGVLAHWLGRPLAGLAWATVRLDGVPAGGAGVTDAGVDRRMLASASVTVAADGTIARCVPGPSAGVAAAFDLCALMPGGGALFNPAPGAGSPRTLDVSFTVESATR